MNTNLTSECLEKIIGSPVGEFIICDNFGNMTLHEEGYVSCDPCYLESFIFGRIGRRWIREAMSQAYPWESYDCARHKDFWCEFVVDSTKGKATCYFRNCGDGVGYFGNCVDSGCVVVLPLAILPEKVRTLAGPTLCTISEISFQQ